MPEGLRNSPPAADNSTVNFGAHGRLLHRDSDTVHGTYKVQAGDSLWSVARDYLSQDGLHASNREIANLVRKIAVDNHIADANKIKSSIGLKFDLPPLHVAPEAASGATPAAVTPAAASTSAPDAGRGTLPQSAAAERAAAAAAQPEAASRAPALVSKAKPEAAIIAPPAATHAVKPQPSQASLDPQADASLARAQAAAAGPADITVPLASASASPGADGATGVAPAGVAPAKPAADAVTKSVIKSALANDATTLHQYTAGPVPLLSAARVDYNLLDDVAKHIPLVGGLMKIQSPNDIQNELTGQFIAAKQADAPTANAAIAAHGQDLKSDVVNGIGTFVAGFGGLRGAELGLQALAKVGLEIPHPLAKAAAFAVLAVTTAVLANEAVQGTAHITMGTKMDSQGKLVSESIASVASMALIGKIPLAMPAKAEAVKFGGLFSTSLKAIGMRAGLGFTPGAAYALATNGPWNTNHTTNTHFTVGQTVEAVLGDGSLTAAASAVLPIGGEMVTNMSRGLWRARNLVGAAAMSNAVYQAGGENPTQINPATGKHYTLAETAEAAVANLVGGAAGGLLIGKVLPYAARIGAWLPFTAASVLKWASNETAGLTGRAAEAEITPGIAGRMKATVQPIEDGVNAARRYLGQQRIGLINKVAGEHTVIGQTVVPHLPALQKKGTDLAVKAAVLATPATNSFVSPAVEFYHWNKADKDANKQLKGK